MKKSVPGLVAAAAIVIFSGTVAQAASWWDRAKQLVAGEEAPAATDAAPLASDDITAALRQALRIGADQVVATLGRADGFNKAPDVRIVLPDSLKKARSMLDAVGARQLGDDLELRLNRAAEAAVPQARALFGDAIKQMTITDAKAILNGPDNSATLYFQEKMSPSLAASMKPIIDDELASAGAIVAYDKLMSRYNSLPLVPDIKADLTDYVLSKTIDGVFLYLGREEAAIRNNPAKQTTALLRKVFGG